MTHYPLGGKSSSVLRLETILSSLLSLTLSFSLQMKQMYGVRWKNFLFGLIVMQVTIWLKKDWRSMGI